MKNLTIIVFSLTLMFTGCSSEETEKEVVEESNSIVCTGETDGSALGSAYSGATLKYNNTYEFDEDDIILKSTLELEVYPADEDHSELLHNMYLDSVDEDDSDGLTNSFEEKDDHFVITNILDFSKIDLEEDHYFVTTKENIIASEEFLNLTCK